MSNVARRAVSAARPGLARFVLAENFASVSTSSLRQQQRCASRTSAALTLEDPRVSQADSAKSDDRDGEAGPSGTAPGELRPNGKDWKAHLPESLTFFSAHNHLSSHISFNTEEGPLTTRLVYLCDQAILLARASAAQDDYIEIRRLLLRANKAYFDIIRSKGLESGSQAPIYETYLVRSGYAHVIRTIGALSGQDGVESCAKMLIDLLRWERRLVDAKLEMPAGVFPQTRPERVAMSKGKSKEQLMEEHLFLSGPFLQDLAPAIYDVMSDLTISNHAAKSGKSRSFSSMERCQLAQDLCKLIRQLPSRVWDPPLSPEWSRFRHDVRQPLDTARDITSACLLMCCRALLAQSQLYTAFQLWKTSVINWDGATKHLDRFQSHLSSHLRSTRRRVVRQRLWNDQQLSAFRDEFKAFTRTLSSFSNMLEPYGLRGPDSTKQAGLHPDFIDTMLRCILAAEKIPRDIQEAFPEDVVRLQGSLHNVRSFFQKTLSASQSDQQLLGLRPSTYKMILHNLARRANAELFSLSPLQSAARILDGLQSESEETQPSYETCTRVMQIAATSRHFELARLALLRAFSLTLQKQTAGTAEKMEGQDLLDEPLLCRLLRDAEESQDRVRLSALLSVASVYCSSQSSSQDPVSQSDQSAARQNLMRTAGASELDIVFCLYPSMHIRRRNRGSEALDAALQNPTESPAFKGLEYPNDSHPNEESDQQRIARRESAPSFDPGLMTKILRLLALKARTGLAERVWKLFQRVVRRRRLRLLRGAQSASVGPPIDLLQLPISAAKVMIRLYATEVARAASRERGLQRQRFASLGRRTTRVGTRVRGWLRINQKALEGSEGGEGTFGLESHLLRDRAMAAREASSRLYMKMRASWRGADERDNGPFTSLQAEQASFFAHPDSDFFHLLLSVFHRAANPRNGLDSTMTPDHYAVVKTIIGDMTFFNIPLPSSLVRLTVH